MSRPVWAEISRSAIAHNVRELKRKTQMGARLMAVVKADGYGHGALEVSRVALEAGAEYLGVATLDEAVALRDAGINAPILILGHTPDDDLAKVIAHDITQTVYSLTGAQAVAAAARKVGRTARIHLKVDSGMSRLGFFPTEDSIALVKQIVSLSGLQVEGIFTHFATADEVDKSYAWEQFARFKWFIKRLEDEGLMIPLKHAANSAAIIDLPETHLDMVRAGIALYGLYPSANQRSKIDLQPAMSLKTRVVFLKEVPAGTAISYGRTYITPVPTRVATLPIGYADGYSRRLSNRAAVLIHGRRAPVIGRVCMDQCLIDVGQIPRVAVGDEVVLFGEQKGAKLPVDELAEILETINYEVVCLITARVRREYL
ncbi:MAG: alanine racemase [Firmicutes bacterium]|nr:alanine racemase [Bacillota bacterium]